MPGQGNPHTSDLLEAALRYAPRTIPLRRRGKVPAVGTDWPNWQATPAAIRAYWERNPTANVGVRTGAGLVVLDEDPRAGGHDLRADLEHEHGELTETVTAATGGGGWHYFYRGPRDLPSFDLGAGLEVKAAGRQVVAAPSVHPDTGAIYEWVEGRGPGEIELAPLPAWVTAGHQERNGRPARTPTSEWVAIVRDGLGEGERNSGLARFTGHLLARDIDARLVAELAHLVNAKCRPPLAARDVDRIVASIAGREIRRRNGSRR